MLIYGNHLVVLPFRHNIKVEEQNSQSETEREHVKSVLPSYMIDLNSLDQPIANVTDFCFLHGYVISYYCKSHFAITERVWEQLDA